MNITIAIRINGAGSITTTQENYKRLNAATLPACPFKDYNAWDLLQDLISMYSWKLTPGHAYPITDFLTICSDAHAEAYRAIFEA